MIGTLTWDSRLETGTRRAGPSDQALMARVARGDSEALSMLYDRYSGAAFGLAIRMLDDRATAEELVQETFWRVWKRAATYCRGRGQFNTWLLSIVHHLAIDEIRRRRSRPTLLPVDRDDERLADVPDSRADVTAAVLAQMSREQVRAALARLPGAQRHVLELAFFQGLTHREISAKLGEPLGTVHTRTRAGLMRLRIELTAANLGPD